jgi:tetratricopeptide (TPR) repeat protein
MCHLSIKYSHLSIKLKSLHTFYRLGNMYRLGLGTDKDIPKALEYYLKAAELNDPKATLVLGSLYAAGVQENEAWLLERDPRKSFNYWHRAATLAQQPVQGVLSNEPMTTDTDVASSAMCNLGNCYFLGIGLNDDNIPSPPNYAVALEFWELSTQLNPKNLRAWLQLGNIYFDGLATTTKRPNFEKALYFYNRCIDEAVEMGARIRSDLKTDDDALPIVPIPELKDGDLDNEVLCIANGMRRICQENLGTRDETKDEDHGELLNDLLSSSSQTSKTVNIATFLNPLKASENVPDYEKTFMQGIRRRNFLEEGKRDALQFRWQYVEAFGASMEDTSSSKPRKEKTGSSQNACCIQ